MATFTASPEAEAGPEGEALSFFLNSWLLSIGQASIASSPQEKEKARVSRAAKSVVTQFPFGPRNRKPDFRLAQPLCKPLDHTAR